jgi:hypothetical protein
MSTGRITSGPIQNIAPTQAPEVSTTPAKEAKVDAVANKSFASKTVSLIGKALKTGLSISLKASFQISKWTVIGAYKVAKAFAGAIRSAAERSSAEKSSTQTKLKTEPKAIQSRSATKLEKVQEAQKNLAQAVRSGKETIAKQKAARQERREIAALERRAKALKSDTPPTAKKRNQDYTNFEKSSSTLSANANLSTQDKKDIAELEARLAKLKES